MPPTQPQLVASSIRADDGVTSLSFRFDQAIQGLGASEVILDADGQRLDAKTGDYSVSDGWHGVHSRATTEIGSAISVLPLSVPLPKTPRPGADRSPEPAPLLDTDGDRATDTETWIVYAGVAPSFSPHSCHRDRFCDLGAPDALRPNRVASRRDDRHHRGSKADRQVCPRGDHKLQFRW